MEISAAEEIVLAAAQLAAEGNRDFTEWDLTVRVWQLNKQRFGLRGYEEKYPDHKRVMIELMGPAVKRGWLKRTSRNHYRLTELGLAETSRLSGSDRQGHRRAHHLHDELSRWAFHRVFEQYLADNSQPSNWLGVAAFLSAAGDPSDEVDRTLNRIAKALTMAEEWLDETGQSQLLRGDRKGEPIDRERIHQLRGFVATLEDRFSRQFQAVRQSRR